MYGLYGLKHHTVEMLPCGTDGRRQRTREDNATQPLDDAYRLGRGGGLTELYSVGGPLIQDRLT